MELNFYDYDGLQPKIIQATPNINTGSVHVNKPRTADTQWRHKEIWKFGPMWQTKYASAVPKNLGVGVDFRPCSAGDFLTGRPWSVEQAMHKVISKYVYGL